MKDLIQRIFKKSGMTEKDFELNQLRRQVTVLFSLLSNLYGADKLVLKAGKLEALNLMRSTDLAERVVALQRIVFEDPTIDEIPSEKEIPAILEEIEDGIADIIARKTVEEKIERQVTEKMQEKHNEYIQEIKKQIVRESEGADNPQTLKKYAELEKLEQRGLSRSAMELLRPTSLEEIVGQERAIKALMSKVASPYPQHVILYGPPGVGKTTAARLVLEAAKKMPRTPFDEEAKFVEVDGSTLRWDPREVTNPLLGSVHDPIYQGARKNLADIGIPEPKLGLVTEAHGGVLFIDELGEMDPMLQNKLLKVMEDKRVYFESSYYDPTDESVPQYIKKLFEDGAPADFLLIGATTRDPSEINPAFRSRAAEVFFEPLTPEHIKKIVNNAAAKLKVKLEVGVDEVISTYTVEGRKAINILADAYGLALYELNQAGKGEEETEITITKDHIYEVAQISRLTPYVSIKGSDTLEVGKIFGLGVSGYLGSVIEIEAIAFKASEKGKGRLRFNETAGSMAKDSVFNAASVVRKLTGKDIADYDIHVNVVGGGRIDGPSAGVAIVLAIISAIENRPIRQDIAVTGEISIQGRVKPVGGVFEKIYGAQRAGIRQVFVPKDNANDIPKDCKGIEITVVDRVEEIIDLVMPPLKKKAKVS
ncbi:ATP-dependent protease, Lon family [Anoxybacter fermentans]|uniref:endopeptidase La n=1 Tax=Anoxybacter fermentans TaxID=1323375 RepID=A0A3S9T189_9FIRM|nr:Lon family ATP-dependent protease [Anoxybacter fermentans]AZR74267.1 ATP-dependent protease, Lon family [Anoxybacter fermentans]